MGTDALPIVIERGGMGVGKRVTFTRGHNHCFSLIVIEFKFVYCHPGFDVLGF